MRWFLAIVVAVIQIAVAVNSVFASNRDVLSDGACIGGGYGSLANFAILCGVVIWSIVRAIQSLKKPNWHASLRPLLTVALSSAIAIWIGSYAMLRCTV